MQTATISEKAATALPPELIEELWAMALCGWCADYETQTFDITCLERTSGNTLKIKHTCKNIHAWHQLFFDTPVNETVTINNLDGHYTMILKSEEEDAEIVNYLYCMIDTVAK